MHPFGLRFTGDGKELAVAAESCGDIWGCVSLFRVNDGAFVRHVVYGMGYPLLHKFLLELCLHGMGQRYSSRQIRCVFPTMGTLHFSSEDFATTCFNPAFAAHGTGVMSGALDNLNLAAQGLRSAVEGTVRGMDLIYRFHDYALSTIDVLRSAVDGGGNKQPVLAIGGHSEHFCFKGRQYVVPTSVLSLSYGE